MPLNVCSLSVRELVEFVLRSGSINSQYRSSKRAVEGTKIHSKLQKKHKRLAKLKGLTYDSEVSVLTETEYKDFIFEIEGRADGVVEEFFSDGLKKCVHIEEIKSTSDIENINEDYNHWHFAQAKCYGYMYALSENFSQITIHLTYCQLETFEEKTFQKTFDFNELKQFFYDLLKAYYKWQKLYFENIDERNKSIKELSFPFEEYRTGQRDFAAAVYKTIYSGKKLFAEAPTGTGKTVSTVFPALKFFGEEGLLQSKIFYATAKTITRQSAQGIIKIMSEKGLKLKTLTLTAKEKICFCEKTSCTPESCKYANGHFDRVNDALFEIISKEWEISKETICKYAQQYTVCPFELGLDVSIFSDFIICDYNYIFDPKAQLKRFFGEGAKGDFVVLVDEAHNLPDRSREMFSAKLEKSEVLAVMRALKDKRLPLYKAFSKLNGYFLSMKKNIGEEKALIYHKYPEELVYILMNIQVNCDKWLAKNEKSECYENVLSLYFNVLDFLRISEFFSKDYVFLVLHEGGDFIVKLMCINPAELLAGQEKKFRSSIFFSATFRPIDYFVDILGGDGKDNLISVKSPFKKENLELIVDSSVSTKFKDRAESVDRICDRIFETIDKKVGNYFVFFPSYDYMEMVGERFSMKCNGIKMCVQPRNLNEEEKENFLNEFCENPSETFVAFAVMGGVFSEGIDLVGSRLFGAIIVGVGLPLITTERDIIKEYFNLKNGRGFDYAYTYPGFNKVLQAAGRVIRTEEDKGTVVLIDSRFAERRYTDMFPLHWRR